MPMGAGELVLESLASAEALRHPWVLFHWWAITNGIGASDAAVGGNRWSEVVEVKGDEQGWRPSGWDSRHV